MILSSISNFLCVYVWVENMEFGERKVQEVPHDSQDLLKKTLIFEYVTFHRTDNRISKT